MRFEQCTYMSLGRIPLYSKCLMLWTLVLRLLRILGACPASKYYRPSSYLCFPLLYYNLKYKF